MTELSILDGARCVSEGEPLYPALGGLPFVVHLDNPLTYLGAGLAGLGAGLDLDGLFVAGKLISFGSAIGILAVLAGHLRIRSGDWRMAWLVVALVVGYHSFQPLTDFFRNRPETPGILFSLAGWWGAAPAPGWPILAAACFGVAFGFKQSFVSAPLAVALQLALEKDVRSLARLASATAAFGALVVLGSLAFLGRGYLGHTVFGRRRTRPTSSGTLPSSMGSSPASTGGSCSPLCSCRWPGWSAATGKTRWPSTWGVCALWTTLIHSKAGADTNYHGELSVLMVTALVWATSEMIARGTRWWPPR